MDVHKRFFTTLCHEEPDQVPTFIQIYDNPFIVNIEPELPLKVRLFHTARRFDALAVSRYLGVDASWTGFSAQKIPHKLKPAIPIEVQNQYGFNRPGYSINTMGEVAYNSWYQDGALKTPELILQYIEFVNQFDVSNHLLAKLFRKRWDYGIKKGVLPIPTTGSIAWNTWSTIGINRISYLIRNHLDVVKKWAMCLGTLAMKNQTLLFEEGVDITIIGEDYAFKERMVYSPRQFTEIIEPVYKMMADNAHKYGAKLIVHTDGNIAESLPSLVRAGIDGIEPLEYESGLRLNPIKAQFGKDLTLIGNVPATDLLSFGTVEDTIKFTKACLRDIAPGGGYILGAG